MEKVKLSAAMEDYIETIYLLEEKNKVARVSDIGRAMNVRKASVVSAVSNLQKMELIIHEKYGYITLTPIGKDTAEKIYKKHKVLFEFLGEILKIDLEKAKEEACQIEHALSQETVDKLAAFIKQYKSVLVPESKPAKSTPPPKSVTKKKKTSASSKAVANKKKSSKTRAKQGRK